MAETAADARATAIVVLSQSCESNVPEGTVLLVLVVVLKLVDQTIVIVQVEQTARETLVRSERSDSFICSTYILDI